jgi:DNA-binding MarR family transcriptional regulator
MCNHYRVARKPTSTDAILEQLGRLIRHLARETGGAEIAMNAAQRIALVELGLDGPFRLNDLAHRMGVSAPTASRAVDALEALGLARRAPDPSDRRALSIELTPEGRRHFEERTARARAAFAPAAESLSAEERRTFLALLERLTDALPR